MRDISYKHLKKELRERIRLVLLESAPDKEVFEKEFAKFSDKEIKAIALRGLGRIVKIVREKKGRVLLQNCKLQQFYYDFTERVATQQAIEFDLDETKGITSQQLQIKRMRKKNTAHEKYLMQKRTRNENQKLGR